MKTDLEILTQIKILQEYYDGQANRYAKQFLESSNPEDLHEHEIYYMLYLSYSDLIKFIESGAEEC